MDALKRKHVPCSTGEAKEISEAKCTAAPQVVIMRKGARVN